MTQSELERLRTRIIRPFDPWRSPLCTCPPKLSLDPYTGCEHGCLYCYASSYIKNFYRCRPKRNLIELVRRDLRRIPEDTLISMSNSSDPYPPMERRLKLTRRCLKEFRGRNLRILIVTKGDTILRPFAGLPLRSSTDSPIPEQWTARPSDDGRTRIYTRSSGSSKKRRGICPPIGVSDSI